MGRQHLPRSLRGLRSALLEYYRVAGRDLPWRHRHDVYGIWLSEVMLQQTRVATVRERYERFVGEFPDVTSLARVEEARVCEAWAGLGYYRRARNLHRTARIIANERHGVWPTSARELVLLPGIGRYTAAAVAAIAFGEPVAAVDGNLVRVWARLLAAPGRPDDSELLRRVEPMATALVAPAPADLNQALMDLGATICTPAQPQCNACPIRRYCAAAAGGHPERFPEPAGRVVRHELQVAFAWIADASGVRLCQRPLDGLWAGLWELPSATGPNAKAELTARFGPLRPRPMATVEHELTHRHVHARVFEVKDPASAGTGLPAFGDPLAAPLSALARKAIVAAAGPTTTPTTTATTTATTTTTTTTTTIPATRAATGAITAGSRKATSDQVPS